MSGSRVNTLVQNLGENLYQFDHVLKHKKIQCCLDVCRGLLWSGSSKANREDHPPNDTYIGTPPLLKVPYLPTYLPTYLPNIYSFTNFNIS